jgi:hypothetical protein
VAVAEETIMKKLLVLALLLMPVQAFAQLQPTVTRVSISVLPATGDPDTVGFVANHELTMDANMPECNKPINPAPPNTLNPTMIDLGDPYRDNRACALPLPPGIPPGAGYRAVTRWFVPSCVVNGQEILNCSSPRSAPSVPFAVGVVLGAGRPAAPVNVVPR